MSDHDVNGDLQTSYWLWHREGMDLAYRLTGGCSALIAELYGMFRRSLNPEVVYWDSVPFDDDDTFDAAWLDHSGRPCCMARIEDGAPMAWRVEFLDMHLKQHLHKILLDFRNQLSLDMENDLELVPEGEKAAS
jgi:hypothetical protein